MLPRLVGDASYRELPEAWVTARVARDPTLEIVAAKRFPVKLSKNSLEKQLDFARDVAAAVDDPGLRDAFAARTRALKADLGNWAKQGTHDRAENYALLIAKRGL